MDRTINLFLNTHFKFGRFLFGFILGFILGGILVSFTISFTKSNNQNEKKEIFTIIDGVVKSATDTGANGMIYAYDYIISSQGSYRLAQYADITPRNKAEIPEYCPNNTIDCYEEKRVRVYGMMSGQEVPTETKDGPSNYAPQLEVLAFDVLD